MGKFKDKVETKYDGITNEEIVIKLRHELKKNIKYIMALDYIIPVFNELNNKGMNLNVKFRKTATQDCIELLYCAYLRKIIPSELPPSNKNIKLLAESLGIMDITLDYETFRSIIFEQFEKDMQRQKMSAIVEISEEYYEDERLEFDISDTDYLSQLKLFNELEYKRVKYFKIKAEYEEALSIVINNYKKQNKLSKTLKKI